MTSKIFSAYDGLLAIVDFVVSRTSDTLADIMIRALPLLAPLPNAISIFYILQHTSDYSTLQAFAVAGSMECMFFALTEVALKLWDRAYIDRRYAWPLGIISVLFVGYFALVMWLVATLEVQQNNYAPLAFPLVSVVAALTLGCERWHKRNIAIMQKPTKSTVQKPKEIVQAVQKSTVQDSAEVQPESIVSPRQRARQLKSEGLTNTQIAAELSVHRNTVGAWLNGHKKAEVA